MKICMANTSFEMRREKMASLAINRVTVDITRHSRRKKTPRRFQKHNGIGIFFAWRHRTHHLNGIGASHNLQCALHSPITLIFDYIYIYIHSDMIIKE
jgi:hypothetical protein